MAKGEPMLEKRVILAGRCVFTVTGKDGTKHYTYKVSKKKDELTWFVYLLAGPDNEADYTYLGMLNARIGEVVLTKASKETKDSVPFRVVNRVLAGIWAGNLDEIE